MRRYFLIILIISIITLLYLFNPLCNLNRVGSWYRASDNCNSCKCTIFGGACTLLACINTETDLDYAVFDCTNKCVTAQSFSSAIEKETSGYCRKIIKIDRDNDKKSDLKARCWSSYINVDCPGVKDYCKLPSTEPINS